MAVIDTREFLSLLTVRMTLMLASLALVSTARPEQVHLSCGDSLDKMAVMWSTQEEASSWAEVGLAPSTLTSAPKATTSRLPPGQALPFVHRTVLEGLQPETKYYYRVVSEHQGQRESSPTFSFKTLPDRKDRKLSFLVYGDLGVVEGEKTFPVLERELATGRYQAVWHVGDFAYDMHEDGGKVGDRFMRRLENISANIPYLVAPGNHEISGDFGHYRTRFSVPNTPWPIPLNQMWYSYDIGPVHFVSYSTEVFFANNAIYTCTQYDWLRQDLAQANRNRKSTPWIIALGHRPMYCSNNDWDDCNTDRVFSGWVRHGLEDLFYAYGVDLVIEAHEHSYERLWPVYQGSARAFNYSHPSAPVHLISGGAGCREFNDPMKASAKPWSAYRHSIKGDNSYGRLTVHNATHLYWDQVRVANGDVMDAMWLVQARHGSFLPPELQHCVDSDKGGNSECRRYTSCPSTFHFMTLAVILAVLTVLGVGACVGVCCFRRHRKRKSRYAHVRLMQEDDDVEDELDMYPA